MSLTIFQSPSREMSMMQTSWASAINPVLAQPLNSGLIISDVVLAVGTNVINHKLSRKQRGWFLVDQNAAVAVYRSAALNDLTLTLTSDAVATVSIFVF